MLGNSPVFKSILSNEFAPRSTGAEQKPPMHDSALIAHATSVFGSRERAEHWLAEYHPSLVCSPMEACATIAGAAEVMKMLCAIGNGWEL